MSPLTRLRARPEPVRYRGIGMALVPENIGIKTRSDADEVIGMLR